MNETQLVRGIRVMKDGSRLVIRWRRLARSVNGTGDLVKEGILFLIGLAMFGFPASGLISKGLGQGWSGFGWGELVSVPFILIGGFMLYRALTILFNTDVIEVTRERLKVRSFPLPPWDMETPTIPLQEVVRVESKVKALSSRQAGRSGVTHNYDVCAILYDGKTRDVVAGSTVSQPAHYVSQEISKFIETVR
ncbi:hypothetical protein ANAEL_02839 [Anaerolineales bacterium]|nr:hypothetical protein ANAEL_02839 [Anaerolineales bacterium]